MNEGIKKCINLFDIQVILIPHQDFTFFLKRKVNVIHVKS